MIFEKAYVREKYELKMLGRDLVFYPGKNPNYLYVFFSSMGYDKYDRYSWYWDETEEWNRDFACLFLKDDDFNYFVGTDEKGLKHTYMKIISHFMKDISKENVFVVGSSMGGYAALYYSIILELKAAIVGNPQITRNAAEKHSLENWRRAIKECGSQFINITDLIDRNFDKKLPLVYFEYSSYPADKVAAEEFISVYSQYETTMFVKKRESKDHSSLFFKKEHLDKIIETFKVFE